MYIIRGRRVRHQHHRDSARHPHDTRRGLVNPMKIAIVSMRQKKDDPYYCGRKGVASELVEKWLSGTIARYKDATFLLPVGNVFDLTAMHLVVQYQVDARLYLPEANWGSKLPQHRQASMNCIKAIGGSIVCDGLYDRMQRMVNDADIIIMFTDGQDSFTKLFTGKKPTIWFPWPSFKELVDQHNSISI